MIGICAQCGPDTEQHWQGAHNSGSEYEGDKFGGGFRVVAEDVVDLRFSGETERGLGDAQRDSGVAGDAQVEGLALIGDRGTERADDDGGGDWLLSCEELMGEMLVGLK